MKDVVLLFSGQGAQSVGMGKDWVERFDSARSWLERARSILDIDLVSAWMDGPEAQLTRTSYCQPALYLHGLMGLELLRQHLPELRPVAAAGLSLGEFTAHAAAGTFGIDDGLKLVAERGRLMEAACEATRGSMAAMLSRDEAAVEALAQECDVDVANRNAPGQLVLSGPEAAIDQAVALAKERGIRRAIKLKVAGAYHSRLMQSAQDELVPVLAATPMQAPGIPVIGNFAARPVADAEEARAMLAAQVTGSVRWTDSIRHLVEAGHTTFVELGPGRVLAGLVAKIAQDVEVWSIDDVPSLEAAVEGLQ